MIHFVGSREAPATIGNNPDTRPVGFGVNDVFYLILTSDHKLIKVTSDAYVSISSSLGFSSVQHYVGQLLFDCRINGF